MTDKRKLWEKIAIGLLTIGMAYGAYRSGREIPNYSGGGPLDERRWSAKPGQIELEANKERFAMDYRFDRLPITNDGGYIVGWETQECRPVADEETLRYLGADCQWIKREMFR